MQRQPAAANAIGFAKFYSRSHDDVIRVYEAAGKRGRDARTQGRFQRALKKLGDHPRASNRPKRCQAIRISSRLNRILVCRYMWFAFER